MFLLFTIQRLEEYAAAALSASAVKPVHYQLIQKVKEELYESLSQHALVLAEAIPWTDQMLMSAISNKNELPYDNLYNWAKQYGQLNQFKGPHPAMLKYWVPFSKRMYNELLTEEEKKNYDKQQLPRL